MRFEVPQFIDIEDKIFGPLTWRQFLYLGGGVGMAVVLFITTPFIVFVLIGIPLGALAGALSFLPINNRPFSYFLEAMFNYIMGQRLYLWKKKEDVVYRSKSNPSTARQTPLANPRTPETKNISSMAKRLELEAMQKNSQ